MRIAIFVVNILYAVIIRGRLLFPLTHDPCGEYSRAATVQSAHLFEELRYFQHTFPVTATYTTILDKLCITSSVCTVSTFTVL